MDAEEKMMKVSESPRRIAFEDLIDLASEDVGSKVLWASDDFFAEKENLIKSAPAVFIADKYTERGKWMDGWESRRKRLKNPFEHDQCLIQLGLPGEIKGINVDTSFFTGNFPEYVSIEVFPAKSLKSGQTPQELLASSEWIEILNKSSLAGGTQNYFAVAGSVCASHVRVRIFPDGGVARLRLHGVVHPRLPSDGSLVDVAAAAMGATVVTANDMYFGNKDHLIYPGRAQNMGEGWETRRKRGPGHDYIIIRLQDQATIEKIEIDTHHFKGNFPDRCSLEGLTNETLAALTIRPENLLACDFRDRPELQNWQPLVAEMPLTADHCHEVTPVQSASKLKFRFLRLNIFPDGGVSRLRVFGRFQK
jgi:allantoicase